MRGDSSLTSFRKYLNHPPPSRQQLHYTITADDGFEFYKQETGKQPVVPRERVPLSPHTTLSKNKSS